MTFNEAKQAYFNEDCTALSMASSATMEKLSKWLDKNDYDASYCFHLYELGKEEMRCIMHEARLEFGF